MDAEPDRDHGGVHINSGIISRTYYLLSEGLPDAIGLAPSEQIFYHALTTGLNPQSQFIDARLACISSAEILFGDRSIQHLKTIEAFDSVELFAYPISPPDPPRDIPHVDATDSLLFTYFDTGQQGHSIGRLETALGDTGTGLGLVHHVKTSTPMSVSASGQGFAFVGVDESLCAMNTSGANLRCDLAGMVHSLAISPNGDRVAVVLNGPGGSPTNRIALLDLQTSMATEIQLLSPGVDGAALNNIAYADSMSFSPDGKCLIYDALSRFQEPSGLVRSVWSLFALDVTSLVQRVFVPPLSGINIGNPNVAHTSDRYVVFEAQDVASGNSFVFVADVYAGTVGQVGVTDQSLAFPGFNGDDTAVIYTDADALAPATTPRSIYWQALNPDRLTVVGGRQLLYRGANRGTIYRRGVVPSANEAPTVSFTAPADASMFDSPATFGLSVAAADSDGSVSLVEFYHENDLVFTDNSAPFEVSLNPLISGSYLFFARAYDDLGASATTPPIAVSVKPSTGAILHSVVGSPTFEFQLNTAEPGVYRIEVSSNLTDWVSIGTAHNVGGIVTLSDFAAGGQTRRFYRAARLP